MILIIVEAVSKVLGMLLVIAIARKLGAGDFGLLAFALSLSFILSFLPLFGFGNLVTKEVARDKTKATSFFGNVTAIKFILSLIAFLIIMLIARLSNYPLEKIWIIQLVALTMIVESYIHFFTSFFRAYQKVEYEAIVKIGLSILNVALGLAVLFSGRGLLELMLVRFSVFGVSLVLTLYFINRKLGIFSIEIDFGYWKDLLRAAWPFALSTALVFAFAQIDTVMLSAMRGDKAAGWYAAAVKFPEMLSFIPACFVGAILPAMSRFYDVSRSSLAATYRQAAKYLLIIALPAATGLSILSDRLVLMFYGSEFYPTIFALRIISWAPVFAYLNYAGFSVFAAENKEKRFALIFAFALGINIGANLVMIPLFGHVGTSVTTLASEIIVFLLQLKYVAKYFEGASVQNIIFKPLLSTLAMAVLIILARQINIFILIPMAALFYLFMLLFLGVFSKEEFSLLLSLIRGDRPEEVLGSTL